MNNQDAQTRLREVLSEPGRSITYRLLSRMLSIHVETAKEAMRDFYAENRGSNVKIYATYWVSGEKASLHSNGSQDAMDVDGDEVEPIRITQSQVLIIPDDILDDARTSFNKIYSEHIYSLATFKIEDDAQLCGSRREIRNRDKEGGSKLAKLVGKITGEDVAPIAAKHECATKLCASMPRPSTSKPTETKPDKEEPSKPAEKPRITAKKGPAKLDWSKAKTKEINTSTPKQEQFAEVVKEGSSSSEPLQARGKKRKSSTFQSKPLQEEESTLSAKPEPVAISLSPISSRVARGRVLSDDEDEELSKKQSRNKVKHPIKIKISDDDLRALMDVDDSEVIRVSSSRPRPSKAPTPPPPSSPEADGMETAETDADIGGGKTACAQPDEDSDDPAPKKEPRKRKPKKVIPVGRNGLKKKRVVKSKTDFDEKGYMVTVDYSSYESVDEEDEVPVKKEMPPKPTVTKSGAKSTTAKGVDTKSTNSASGSKKAAPSKGLDRSSSTNKNKSAGGGQKTLGSFFVGKSKG